MRVSLNARCFMLWIAFVQRGRAQEAPRNPKKPQETTRNPKKPQETPMCLFVGRSSSVLCHLGLVGCRFRDQGNFMRPRIPEAARIRTTTCVRSWRPRIFARDDSDGDGAASTWGSIWICDLNKTKSYTAQRAHRHLRFSTDALAVFPPASAIWSAVFLRKSNVRKQDFAQTRDATQWARS